MTEPQHTDGSRRHKIGYERYEMINPDASATGRWQPEHCLYSDGAFIGRAGPVLAPAGASHERITGTPFLDPATGDISGAYHPNPEEVSEFRCRIAQTAVPDGGGRYGEMAHVALFDLFALMRSNGAVQGAGSPYWAFVWPRDNSLVVVAFALLGRWDEAWAALRYVYAMQEPDGQWEARYLPNGSGAVPDERGRQDDGIGYTLWATWVAAQLSPAPRSAAELNHLAPAIFRSVGAASAVLDPSSALPRPSQDFWEMDQLEPSLGVAGPLHVGLRAGALLAHQFDEIEIATRAQQHADRLLTAIKETYGANGFQRFPSGGGRDASVTFLLPPFVAATDAVPQGPEDVPGAACAWRATLREMRLANGGLRPGVEWPDSHTAWNTQTSLYALTAAATGDCHTARSLLDWMNARRTRLGCLPEKVTAAGEPAAVAPICTVAGTVLIVLALLDGVDLPIPRRLPIDAAEDPTSPMNDNQRRLR